MAIPRGQLQLPPVPPAVTGPAREYLTAVMRILQRELNNRYAKDESGNGVYVYTPDRTKVYLVAVDNAGAVTSTLAQG